MTELEQLKAERAEAQVDAKDAATALNKAVAEIIRIGTEIAALKEQDHE